MTVQQIPTPAALRHCDPMALAKLMQEPCHGCGCEQRHGWFLKNGRATCPRCGFVALVKAKKAKAAKQRPPAPRPPVAHCPSSSPRPREGGARMVAASGRHGTGRDDGGGGDDDDDGDGGGGSDPPPPSRSGVPFAGGAP